MSEEFNHQERNSSSLDGLKPWFWIAVVIVAIGVGLSILLWVLKLVFGIAIVAVIVLGLIIFLPKLFNNKDNSTPE